MPAIHFGEYLVDEGVARVSFGVVVAGDQEGIGLGEATWDRDVDDAVMDERLVLGPSGETVFKKDVG